MAIMCRSLSFIVCGRELYSPAQILASCIPLFDWSCEKRRKPVLVSGMGSADEGDLGETGRTGLREPVEFR